DGGYTFADAAKDKPRRNMFVRNLLYEVGEVLLLRHVFDLVEFVDHDDGIGVVAFANELDQAHGLIDRSGRADPAHLDLVLLVMPDPKFAETDPTLADGLHDCGITSGDFVKDILDHRPEGAFLVATHDY